MNILCFVHLPLLTKLLSILHSNALLGRLVYVLIGLSLLTTAGLLASIIYIDKTTLHIGYVQFFVRTDHDALVFSP